MSEQRSPGRVYSVVYIDLLPEQADKGTGVLVGYLREAFDDDTLHSIKLLRQSDANNHFILQYSADSRSAFDAHQGRSYVRRFRGDLHPLLGSPWDERTAEEVDMPAPSTPA